MIKLLMAITIVAIIANITYVGYLGITENRHDNAATIASDANQLVQTITETIKDGTTVMAERVVPSAKQTADTNVKDIIVKQDTTEKSEK